MNTVKQAIVTQMTAARPHSDNSTGQHNTQAQRAQPDRHQASRHQASREKASRHKTSREKISQWLVMVYERLNSILLAKNAFDYVVALLFVKYISDIWQQANDDYQAKYADDPALVTALMNHQRFIVPAAAHFSRLWQQRRTPGNGERIDQALQLIEQANASRLTDGGSRVFEHIRFNSDVFGDEVHKNRVLRQLLEDFARPLLSFKSSRLSSVSADHPTAPDPLTLISQTIDSFIQHLAASGKRHGAKPQTGEANTQVYTTAYTPSVLCELVAVLVDPQPGQSICDPSCGSGALLLHCGKQVRKHHQYKHYALFGQQSDRSIWSLAKLNLLLQGEDNHQIAWGDTISDPKLLTKSNSGFEDEPPELSYRQPELSFDGAGLEAYTEQSQLKQFDIVVACLPLGVEQWGYETARYDPYNRFWRGLPAKNKSEYAFIQHMIETLRPTTGNNNRTIEDYPDHYAIHPVTEQATEGGAGKQDRENSPYPGGRMAVIVPHGVLFRGGSEGAIRQQLIEENLLEAVIGLPEKLFYGTAISLVILMFSRAKVDQAVLFIDASRAFIPGKNLNGLSDQQIAKIVTTYQCRQSVDHYAYLAPLNEIRQNEYNLNIPRYMRCAEQPQSVDLSLLQQQRQQIQNQLLAVEAKVAEDIRALTAQSDSQTKK